MLTGGDGSIKKCEMFDCGQWKPLPDLNRGRYGHSSAAFNANTVYVFCGFLGGNSIERWAVGEEKWTTIQTKGDILFEKRFRKSVQVDEKFILVFGGVEDKTSFKFFPENDEVKKAPDMAEDCDMDSMPEPFYDMITKAVYVCEKDNHNIHKFDQDGNWSIAVKNIRGNSVPFE